MPAIKLSPQQGKLAKMISENAVGGVISNPSRFWKEADYLNQKVATAVISFFCNKKGLLARNSPNTYRVCYSFAPDGRAVIQSKVIVEELKDVPECCAFFLLTPEEKDLFDGLREIQLPENGRLREIDVSRYQLDTEDWEGFSQKMIRCGALTPVHGKTTKGKLFEVDSERIQALSSRITVMADVDMILGELQGRWKSVDAVLSTIESSKDQLSAALKPVKADETDQSDGLDGVVKKLKNSQQENRKRIAIFQLLADLDDRAKIEIMCRLTSPRK